MYELYKNPQVYRLPNWYIDNITLHVNKC
jgi:hypothetical protein